MTDQSSPVTELLNRAEHYVNCNAVESGADILIVELADALRSFHHAPTPAEVTDEMLERATAAFYEQQEGPINFTAGMRAALTAALSDTSTVSEGKDHV